MAMVGALHDSVTILAMRRLDAGRAIELLERERGTAVIGWPTFTQRIRDHEKIGRRDLSSAPMLLDGPADLSMIGTPKGPPAHRA